MLFTLSTLSLLLALAPTALLAAPTRTIEHLDSLANIFPRADLPSDLVSQLARTNSLCDLSKVTLPTAPTPLSPITPGLTLRHIALGRGTQNYTCASLSPSQPPKPLGALATLFNATCDAARLPPTLLTHITRLALAYPPPTGPLATARTSGHHEFTAQGVPLFRLATPATGDLGFVLAKPEAGKSGAPAGAARGPNGMGSVPWIKLVGVGGDYKEVYRVETAGGMAPKDCSGVVGEGGPFSVEYSAQYWFYA